MLFDNVHSNDSTTIINMSDIRNWTRDSLKEFIEIYRQNECLWKIRSDNYLNKSLKDKSYEKLRKKMLEVDKNATVLSVKKKINSLRTNFRAELRKVNNCKRSGDGEEETYKPSLWYYDELWFLRDQETQKHVPNKKPSYKFASTSEELDAGFEESQEMESQNEESTEMLIDNNDNRKETASIVAAPLSSNQKRKRKSNDNMESILKPICKLQKISDRNKESKEVHEFDVFCSSLAIQLKKMPLLRALVCQEKLQSVMTQERISQLLPENSQPVRQTSPYSTNTLSPSTAGNPEDSSQDLFVNGSESYTSLNFVTQATCKIERLSPNDNKSF